MKLIAFIFCLVPATGLLAETAEVVKPAAPEVPSVAGSLIRVIAALAIVFGVFFCGVWLLRNWQRLAARRNGGARLNVIEARSIGPRQTLLVVGYERQRMLIASSPAGVALLTALPDSKEEPAATTPPPPAFSDILKKVTGNK